MLFHGISKVRTGIDFIVGALQDHGLPGFLAYGVYLAEVVAATMNLLGLLTRLASLVLAFNMLVAILLVLRDRIFTVNEMGGAWAIEIEMFFLLGALSLFFLGGGKFSVMAGKTRWD